jgi:mutator protein MutT
MYKVVLRSKSTGEIEGYLGSYNSFDEATDIVDRFNLKADRHPSIAEIEGVDSEIDFDDSTETFDFEDSEESEDDYESEEESEDDRTTFMFNRTIQPKPKRNNPVRELMFSSSRNPVQEQDQKRVLGILIDDKGWVLLRQPANEYMGIKWEFYGGHIDYGETKEQAVIRETREETGFKSKIISKLGVYRSNNIKYYVFLLEKTSDQAEWMDFQNEEEETWETQFVPVAEAESMLRKNKDIEYRKMLLKALSEAYHRWKMNRLRG